MARWFRVYDDLIDDPKYIRLPDSLKVALHGLWCVASKNLGQLPQKSDIAISLRKTVKQVELILAQLMAAGLIDRTESGLEPHNWRKRQHESDVSTTRVQQFRERERKRNETVSETAPDTETEAETEAETEKKERTRASALRPPSRFDQFWELYPQKVGKGAARKSFERVEKVGSVEFQSLMASLRLYRGKMDDRPWCNPATWLNQERWNDVPAPLVVPQNRDPQKQELKDVISRLRGNGTIEASGGRADGLLLENSRIGGSDIRGEIGGIVDALSWDGGQDCESDQRDTGKVQVLSFVGRHQGRA